MAVQDNTVMVGSLVAVLDSAEDTHYHVAEVTDMADDLTMLRYLGTKSKTLRSAVWQYAYMSNRTTVLKDREHPALQHRQLIGSVRTLPIGESLIIMPNLGLDEHMRFTKDTIEILKDFPEKHHVHGMTWARTKRKRKRKT